MAARLPALLALAGALIAAACSRHELTDPALADGRTTYALTSINGSPLPAVLGENPLGKMEILSESYRLEPSLRYVHGQEYRQTDAAGVRVGTLSDSGTYVLRSDSIFFTFARATGTFRTSGAIESGKIVIRHVAQGVTLVFDPTQ